MLGKMIKVSFAIALILLAVAVIGLTVLDYLEAEKIRKEKENIVLDEYGVEVEYIDFVKEPLQEEKKDEVWNVDYFYGR